MRDKTHVDNLDIKRNGRLGWKPSTIFVRLDFIKCVQIFLSSKTKIYTVCLDSQYRFALLARKSVHVFCTDMRFGGKENLETVEKI